MIGAARKPMAGVYRTWSDGKCVHLLVRITGGNLGREPVTMHSKTELAPVRSAVRGQLAARESAMAGDPVEVEALATRVGGFGLFRRIGRAAKGAAMFATAPARALGSASLNTWRTTTNLAKGLEGAAALTTYATKPLTWRPGKKSSGPSGPAPARESESDRSNPDEEEPMNDESSGTPRPQTTHILNASRLLRRAQSDPKSARHVKNIAKAAAQGHPGAKVAQAALQEARRKQPPAPAPLPGPAPSLALAVRSAAFPAWAKGAA